MGDSLSYLIISCFRLCTCIKVTPDISINCSYLAVKKCELLKLSNLGWLFSLQNFCQPHSARTFYAIVIHELKTHTMQLFSERVFICFLFF